MFSDFNHSSHRKIDLSGSSGPSFVRGRLSGRGAGTGVLGAAATAASSRSSLLEYQRRERQLRERHRKCVDAALKIQKQWRSSAVRSAAKTRERHEFDEVLDEVLSFLGPSGFQPPHLFSLQSRDLPRASFLRIRSALPRLILQLAFFFDVEEGASGRESGKVTSDFSCTNADFLPWENLVVEKPPGKQPADRGFGSGKQQCGAASWKKEEDSQQARRSDADRLRILCDWFLLLCREHEQRHEGAKQEEKIEKGGASEGCCWYLDTLDTAAPSPSSPCIVCLLKTFPVAGRSSSPSSCSVLAAFRLRLLLHCASLRYHSLLFQCGAPPSLHISCLRRFSSIPAAPPQPSSSSPAPLSSPLTPSTGSLIPFQTTSRSPAKVPRLRSCVRAGGSPSSTRQNQFSRAYLRPAAGWRGSVLGSSLSLRSPPLVGDGARGEEGHSKESCLSPDTASMGWRVEETAVGREKAGRAQQRQPMSSVKDRWGGDENSEQGGQKRRALLKHPPLLLVPDLIHREGEGREYLNDIFFWVNVVSKILLAIVPTSTAECRGSETIPGTEVQSPEGLRSVMRPTPFLGGGVLTGILGDALACLFRTDRDMAYWQQIATLTWTSTDISAAYNDIGSQLQFLVHLLGSPCLIPVLFPEAPSSSPCTSASPIRGELSAEAKVWKRRFTLMRAVFNRVFGSIEGTTELQDIVVQQQEFFVPKKTTIIQAVLGTERAVPGAAANTSRGRTERTLRQQRRGEAEGQLHDLLGVSPLFWWKEKHDESTPSEKSEGPCGDQLGDPGGARVSSSKERETSALSGDTVSFSLKMRKPVGSCSPPCSVAGQEKEPDRRSGHALPGGTRNSPYDHRLCWSSEGACLSLRVVGNLLAFIQNELVLRDARSFSSSEQAREKRICSHCEGGCDENVASCTCSREGERGANTVKEDSQRQGKTRSSSCSQDEGGSQEDANLQSSTRVTPLSDSGMGGRSASGEAESGIPKGLLCLLCWAAGFAHEELLRQSVLSLEEQTLEGSTEGEEALKLRRQLKMLMSPCVLKALFACADDDPSNRLPSLLRLFFPSAVAPSSSLNLPSDCVSPGGPLGTNQEDAAELKEETSEDDDDEDDVDAGLGSSMTDDIQGGTGGQNTLGMDRMILNALAMNTSLSSHLLPVIRPVFDVECQGDVDEFIKRLGSPPLFDAPLGQVLRAACTLLQYQLELMYDSELVDSGSRSSSSSSSSSVVPSAPRVVSSTSSAPLLTVSDIQWLSLTLNKVAWKLLQACYSPPASSLTTATAVASHQHSFPVVPASGVSPASSSSLRGVLNTLVKQLFDRNSRLHFLPESSWILPETMHLLKNKTLLHQQERLAELDAPSFISDHLLGGGLGGNRGTGTEGLERVANTGIKHAGKILASVLTDLPHTMTFEDRVLVFYDKINAERQIFRDAYHRQIPFTRNLHEIRREYIVEDGLFALGYADEHDLKGYFRVQFITDEGVPEEGIDGGGLFKEFLVLLSRKVFDPDYGLFKASSDNTLYPNPSAHLAHADSTALYNALGKVVGKALYEKILIEPQLNRVFLNLLLGRPNHVDDVQSLDPVVHRNLLFLKQYPDNVQNLALTFSVTLGDFGSSEEEDLIPHGRSIPVTNDSKLRYIQAVSYFKCTKQIAKQTEAFRSGLSEVIPIRWLKMFSPSELQLLISGSTLGFDVADLRDHAHFTGGFDSSSDAIQWLWEILEEMTNEERSSFLMFVTSCSRPPLLGFRNLQPSFTVHRVPETLRLPTSSTCVNLLKLPSYESKQILKERLMEAIEGAEGFGLS